MTLSKLSYLVVTIVFLVITASVSYFSYPAPIQKQVATITPLLANGKFAEPIPTVKPQIVVPTKDIRCIITVDNQKYDVTTFKNQHSGGDIFNCGTDMSAVFRQQHSQKFLKQMNRYKL